MKKRTQTRKQVRCLLLWSRNIIFVFYNVLAMEFVDRIEEQKRLQKALNGEKAAFVVVYGRRRLGKSTLIKRVLTPNDVYYICLLYTSPSPRDTR